MNWKKRYNVNLLFWISYFLYEWLENAAFDDSYRKHFIPACLYVGFACLVSWFTVQVIIRGYFLRGHRTKAWIYLGSSAVFFSIARRTVSFFLIYPILYGPAAPGSVGFLYVPKIIIEGVWLYLIVGFNTMLYFMQAWQEQ